jgi:hypothetical protein
VGLGFSSNPKFRVFRKSKVRLFHYFWVWILTVPLRSSLLGVLVSNILSEEVWGRESSRVGFCLTQNLGFLRK